MPATHGLARERSRQHGIVERHAGQQTSVASQLGAVGPPPFAHSVGIGGRQQPLGVEPEMLVIRLGQIVVGFRLAPQRLVVRGQTCDHRDDLRRERTELRIGKQRHHGIDAADRTAERQCPQRLSSPCRIIEECGDAKLVGRMSEQSDPARRGRAKLALCGRKGPVARKLDGAWQAAHERRLARSSRYLRIRVVSQAPDHPQLLGIAPPREPGRSREHVDVFVAQQFREEPAESYIPQRERRHDACVDGLLAQPSIEAAAARERERFDDAAPALVVWGTFGEEAGHSPKIGDIADGEHAQAGDQGKRDRNVGIGQCRPVRAIHHRPASNGESIEMREQTRFDASRQLIERDVGHFERVAPELGEEFGLVEVSIEDVPRLRVASVVSLKERHVAMLSCRSLQITSNTTGMQAALTLTADPSGRDFCLVVIVGTFITDESGRLSLDAAQVPPRSTDEHYGDPTTTPVRYECDFVLEKPVTDVVVVGKAVAPDGVPVRDLPVRLELPGRAKDIVVHGERRFVKTFGQLRPSEAAPFVEMPLTFDRAFGGMDDSRGPDRVEVEARNLVGVGFHPLRSGAEIEGLPVPNLESPYSPIGSPRKRYEPVGLGVIARNWQPRLGYAGTYDQDWRDRHAPYLPPDFNPLFHQFAPTDQQLRELRPGDRIRCVHMARQPVVSYVIPEIEVPVRFRSVSADSHRRGRLDGVILEPHLRRAQLVWRCAVPVGKRPSDMREINIGAFPRTGPVASRAGKPVFRNLDDTIQAIRARRRGGES